MREFTRYKIEELVDRLNGKIHHGVVCGHPARFSAEENAQYLLADVALSQDAGKKGACAEQAEIDYRALRRKAPQQRNLTELFEDALGPRGVADMQQELERAGMVFSAKRTLIRHRAPR